MPRKQAPLRTAIWDDQDFVALSAAAQRLYFQLLSQKRLTMVGVVPWLPVNLARGCAEITVADIEKAAAELVETNYVFIDHETCELHIRTMVKHDPPRGVKAAAGAWSAFLEVDSLEIKRRIFETASDDMRKFLTDEKNKNMFRQVNTLFPESYPQEINNRPSTSLLPPSTSLTLAQPQIPAIEAATPPEPESVSKSTKKDEMPEDFMKFYTAYPKHQGREPALKRWKRLPKADRVKALEAVGAYARERQGQDPQYTPLPARWLNEKRWEDVGATKPQHAAVEVDGVLMDPRAVS